MRRKRGRGGVVKSRRATSREEGANRISDRSAYGIKLNLNVFIALTIFITLLFQRRLDACFPKVVHGGGNRVSHVIMRVRCGFLMGRRTRGYNRIRARSCGLCRAINGMSALRWGVGRRCHCGRQRVRCEICM